ncbi:MAG: L-aspartate oxidase [Thermomicrobiales bacterium]
MTRNHDRSGTASSAGLPAFLCTPVRTWQDERAYDIVIVGAGIAGLSMALRLPAEMRIAVVTKGVLGESNTRYAQGGFAAPIGPDDHVELHIADTLVAGAGLSDEPAVRELIEGAADAVTWLIAEGTTFDREPDQNDELVLGREAAHSRNRILHAGGDATGHEIERALVAQLRARDGVEIHDRTAAVDLVLENGHCRGVIVQGADAPDLTLFSAPCVTLANGGAGQLWAVTSNPSGATGDGMAMALRSGAVLADLEFAQFHPTVLTLPDGDGFLITEAVRGEGAYLRGKDGERFMLEIDPLGELAPRDVVARGIQRQMALDELPFVHLDLRHLDPDLVKRRFPTISSFLATMDLDLANDLIPVAPAAHYFMGGIAAGTDGRTSIPGLRAIGEVSCTGVHGANRLASNSLLEGLVFGLEAAASIRAEWASGAWDRTLPPPSRRPVVADGTQQLTSDQVAAARGDVQRLMSDDVAVVRSADSLVDAEAGLRDIAAAVDHLRLDTFAAIELRNMILLAAQVVASAEFREESRGGHFRADFPDRAPGLDGEHQLVVRQDGGFARCFGSIGEALAPIAAERVPATR